MQRQIALQQQRQTMQQAQAQASGTCSHCGTICPTSAKFCPQCGQSINPNAPIYLLIQHPNRAIQHQNRAIWAGFTTLMTLMLALYGGSLWIWSDKHFEPKIQQAQMELAAFDREVQTTGMLTGVSYSETKRKWNDTYQKGAKSIQKIENEANFYKVLAVCLIAPLVINLIYWFIIFAF
jgi:RNA polymerase subunit RPABC4/transcription elongation factor Spt4